MFYFPWPQAGDISNRSCSISPRPGAGVGGSRPAADLRTSCEQERDLHGHELLGLWPHLLQHSPTVPAHGPEREQAATLSRECRGGEAGLGSERQRGPGWGQGGSGTDPETEVGEEWQTHFANLQFAPAPVLSCLLTPESNSPFSIRRPCPKLTGRSARGHSPRASGLEGVGMSTCPGHRQRGTSTVSSCRGLQWPLLTLVRLRELQPREQRKPENKNALSFST